MKCSICGRRVEKNRILISSGYLCGDCATAYRFGLTEGLKQTITDVKRLDTVLEGIDRKLDMLSERMEGNGNDL